MHAVVFQVDMKPGTDPTTAERELDQLVAFVTSRPGFVHGTWLSDGARGLSVIVFEAEEVALGIAQNASMPPDAGVTLRSVDVYAVAREA